MTTQAWIILTPTEANDAVLLNDEEILVEPQEIVNPLADNLGEGTLVGKFVLPARLLNDPDYVRWVSSLGSKPIRTMDSETLFSV